MGLNSTQGNAFFSEKRADLGKLCVVWPVKCLCGLIYHGNVACHLDIYIYIYI